MNYEWTINVLQVNYKWTTKSWMEIHVMNFIHHVTMSNIGVNDNSQLLLQLQVICFRLIWIIINNTKPSWLMNLNLCSINGSMYYKETTKVMKTSHNLNQIIFFWPFDLILKHSIHKKRKLMKNKCIIDSNYEHFVATQIVNSKSKFGKFLKGACNPNVHKHCTPILCILFFHEGF